MKLFHGPPVHRQPAIQRKCGSRRRLENAQASLSTVSTLPEELVPPWMKDGEPEAAREGDASRASQTGSRSLQRSTPKCKTLSNLVRCEGCVFQVPTPRPAARTPQPPAPPANSLWPRPYPEHLTERLKGLEGFYRMLRRGVYSRVFYRALSPEVQHLMERREAQEAALGPKAPSHRSPSFSPPSGI